MSHAFHNKHAVISDAFSSGVTAVGGTSSRHGQLVLQFSHDASKRHHTAIALDRRRTRVGIDARASPSSSPSPSPSPSSSPSSSCNTGSGTDLCTRSAVASRCRRGIICGGVLGHNGSHRVPCLCRLARANSSAGVA